MMTPKNSGRISKIGATASINDQLKKAATEMLVLFVPHPKPMYIYGMMNAVERLKGRPCRTG